MEPELDEQYPVRPELFDAISAADMQAFLEGRAINSELLRILLGEVAQVLHGEQSITMSNRVGYPETGTGSDLDLRRGELKIMRAIANDRQITTNRHLVLLAYRTQQHVEHELMLYDKGNESFVILTAMRSHVGLDDVSRSATGKADTNDDISIDLLSEASDEDEAPAFRSAHVFTGSYAPWRDHGYYLLYNIYNLLEDVDLEEAFSDDTGVQSSLSRTMKGQSDTTPAPTGTHSVVNYVLDVVPGFVVALNRKRGTDIIPPSVLTQQPDANDDDSMEVISGGNDAGRGESSDGGVLIVINDDDEDEARNQSPRPVDTVEGPLPYALVAINELYQRIRITVGDPQFEEAVELDKQAFYAAVEMILVPPSDDAMGQQEQQAPKIERPPPPGENELPDEPPTTCDALFTAMLGYIRVITEMRAKDQRLMQFKEQPVDQPAAPVVYYPLAFIARAVRRLRYRIVKTIEALNLRVHPTSGVSQEDFIALATRRTITASMLHHCVKSMAREDRVLAINRQLRTSDRTEKTHHYLVCTAFDHGLTLLSRLANGFYGCYHFFPDSTEDLTAQWTYAQEARAPIFDSLNSRVCLSTTLIPIAGEITGRLLLLLIKKIIQFIENDQANQVDLNQLLQQSTVASDQLDALEQCLREFTDSAIAQKQLITQQQQQGNPEINMISDDTDEDDEDASKREKAPPVPLCTLTGLTLTAMQEVYIPDDVIDDQCAVFSEANNTGAQVYLYSSTYWAAKLLKNTYKEQRDREKFAAYIRLLMPLRVHGNHWSLAIIHPREAIPIVYYYTSLEEDADYLDTLKEHMDPHLNLLYPGLQFQYINETVTDFQQNAYDCAIFVIKRIADEYISLNLVQREPQPWTRVHIVNKLLQRMWTFMTHCVTYPKQCASSPREIICRSVIQCQLEYTEAKRFTAGRRDEYLSKYLGMMGYLLKNLQFNKETAKKRRSAATYFTQRIQEMIEASLGRERIHLQIDTLYALWDTVLVRGEFDPTAVREKRTRGSASQADQEPTTAANSTVPKKKKQKQTLVKYVESLLATVSLQRQHQKTSLLLQQEALKCARTLPVKATPEIKDKIASSLLHAIVRSNVTDSSVLTQMILTVIDP